jgi:hypothetical protein
MTHETETVWTLLSNGAHWQFEIITSIVFDLVVVGIMWPFIQKHWGHHLEADKIHGFNNKKKKPKRKRVKK